MQLTSTPSLAADAPSVNLYITCCTFENKADNNPKPWNIEWAKLAKVLSAHKVRADKDGRLWSPTVYRNGSGRGNEGVEAITAAVGDFDTGLLTHEDILPRIAPYEHVAHSTHSHTPSHPKFRVVIPFTRPVPVADWPDIKARVDEHLFRMAADAAAKDPARMYYLPSCPAQAEHFAHHNPGELLDPYTLPPASRPAVTAESAPQSDERTTHLGKAALIFVAHGAPIRQQRDSALRAARNHLSSGYSEEETIEAIWQGLQASPKDPARGAWSKDEAIAIVLDLASKAAPPLKELAPTARNGGHQGTEKAPPTRRPMVVQHAAVSPEKVEILWHPDNPLGKLTLREGAPSAGKSWLALAIASAISLGVKLPGATEARGPAGYSATVRGG
ncbi:MAG: hypothetical protein Q8O76_06850, partial [Chloroflexota bacterium]|nr:hypothetical protein [Chloroflexota bacterium]